MEKIKSLVNKRKKLFALAALFIIGLALYANSFNNQLFWDDDDVITNNVFIKDWQYWPKFFSDSLIAGAGQVSNYWRPLLLVSFSLDYHLWGLNPASYHLTNTLLHLIAAGLIFLFILKISQRRWLSFLTALFFLIHPLNTEAVTYAAGRADPLSAVFLLLSLIFYLDFRRDQVKIQAPEPKVAWLKISLSLLFFIMALLIKEQSVILPALIILLELVIVAGPQEKFIKKFLPVAAYVLIASIYLLLHFTLFNFNDLLGGFDYDYSSAYNTSFLIRFWTFLKVMLEYWRLLIWPTGLHMAREVAPVMSFFSWPVALFLSVSAGLIVLAVKTWRRDKLIAFGLIWYFILLLPRTNLLKINRPMYEHWLYLPMVGFWLMLFVSAELLWRKINRPELKHKVKFAGLLILIIFSSIFSWLTIKRNRDWRNPITFYEKNLRYTPNSFIQHNNLGMAYAAAGQNQLAIKEYRQAISIKDVYAQVHYNLANALVATADYKAAEKEYQTAISMSPTFQFPYQNLLSLYINAKKSAEAENLLQAMKKNLDETIYLKYAGLTKYYFADFQSALTLWRELLRLEPNNLEIKGLINLASQAKYQKQQNQ